MKLLDKPVDKFLTKSTRFRVIVNGVCGTGITGTVMHHWEVTQEWLERQYDVKTLS